MNGPRHRKQNSLATASPCANLASAHRRTRHPLLKHQIHCQLTSIFAATSTRQHARTIAPSRSRRGWSLGLSRVHLPSSPPSAATHGSSAYPTNSGWPQHRRVTPNKEQALGHGRVDAPPPTCLTCFAHRGAAECGPDTDHAQGCSVVSPASPVDGLPPPEPCVGIARIRRSPSRSVTPPSGPCLRWRGPGDQLGPSTRPMRQMRTG
jgi:hypothetical protein